MNGKNPKVFDYKEDDKSFRNLKLLKDNKCPICGESILIKINDYKITLNDCKNQHRINNIFLDEYENIQKNGYSKMKCDKCQNRDIIFNDKELYKCTSCNINICSICKLSHESTHILINYEDIKHICFNHNKPNNSYCKECKLNICKECLNDNNHKNHDIISYNEIQIDKNIINNQMNELRNKINRFNVDVKKIINKLDTVMKNLNILYKISYNIMNKINENIYLNYEEIQDIKKMDNNYVIKDINLILNEKSISNKFQRIIDLEEKMKHIDELTIIYKNDNNFKNEGFNLFGLKFIEKNEKKLKLFYNDKEFSFNDNYIIKSLNENKKEIQIILKGINNINDFSYMFCGCKSLISLPDISKLNTSNITSMAYMFYGCSSLKNINSIKKFKTNNVTDMSYMFSGCSSLKYLPDISIWDTSNLLKINHMFENCFSLLFLPDLSKWKTSNIINMAYLFNNCKSLKTLPDISKWKTNKINDMSYIFSNCSKLVSLPNISKWNISNVRNLDYLFSNCKKIQSLPDISKWKISNVKSMGHTFYKCSSLKFLPEISKWDTSKVENIAFIFADCKSLETLPDISKWNTDRLINACYIFSDCSSLKCIPDISKWKTTNLKNMSFIIYKCSSLKSIPNFSAMNLNNIKNKESISFIDIPKIPIEKSALNENTNSKSKMSMTIAMLRERSYNSEIISISILTKSKIIKQNIDYLSIIKQQKLEKYIFIVKTEKSDFFITLNIDNNNLLLYNTKTNLITKIEQEYGFIKHIFINKYKEKSKYAILISSNEGIFKLDYYYKKNKFGYHTQPLIPINNCKYILKLKNNNYIFLTNDAIYQTSDIYNIKIPINKINIDNQYISAIQINDNYCIFNSNKIFIGGENMLDFYNIYTHKINLKLRIKNYSFIISENGLALISLEKIIGKKIIILCACKKYYSVQKNGILLVTINDNENGILNKGDINNIFYNTYGFEVFCFCQLFYIKTKNIFFSPELEQTNYFLVGGLNKNKLKGIIKLYEIIYDDINNIKIEYLKDIEIYNFKCKGIPYHISQSRETGLINIFSSDGYHYQIDNINFIIEELNLLKINK